MRYLLMLIACLLIVFPAAAQDDHDFPILFDDFSYESTEDAQFTANGWIIRTIDGWPGVPGAIWNPENVTIVPDPDAEDDAQQNFVVQMIASSDGTTTTQTQFCQQRNFLVGTYAARVRFSDEPAVGIDGDQLVQTFYTIAPLEFEMDPNYSELDFEYLPNGGWGMPSSVFFTTTWETFRPEPNWFADNTSGIDQASYAGWHTLLVQVTDESVTYFIDGEEFAHHTGKYVPEVPMSINFNQWFINGGLVDSDEYREYVELVDWAFHAYETILTPEEVDALILTFRADEIAHLDTIPQPDEPLNSPCDF